MESNENIFTASELYVRVCTLYIILHVYEVTYFFYYVDTFELQNISSDC